MAVSALSNISLLQSVSSLSGVAPLESTATPPTDQQSQKSSATTNSASTQLAADTYTATSTATGTTTSSATTSNQPGPETTLDGHTLAQNQTISADLDVRLALIQDGGYYIKPTDQAWSTLTNSLASGDIATAQTALTAYTQALPSDPSSLSPLTSPSTQFLSDLTTLGSALQSGDLTAAKTAFQTAQYDKPDNVLGVFSQAYDTGNTSVEATMSLESVENTTAQLIWLGYTPANAKIEANIIEIAAEAGLSTGNSQSDSAQTKQMIVDLAKDVASGPQITTGQAKDTSGNPFYNIVTSLLTMKSQSDLTKTLELLDSTYGAGGSNTSTSSNTSSSGLSASVSTYA